MKFFPTKIAYMAMLCMVLTFLNSCGKDSDLFNEMILQDSVYDDDIENRNGSTENSSDSTEPDTEQSNVAATSSNLTPITGELLAFPGAKGFGKYASGGRGGKVIEVTNLNDSGPGSLREAVESSGRRIIIFKVSGEIELNSTLTVHHDNMTIAGQSAGETGGGITLKMGDAHGQPLFSTGTASNLIIQHLRFRRGPGVNNETNGDTFISLGGSNVIVDHCSFSWSTDELVNINFSSDWTLQNCIFSEALSHSTHGEGEHSKGVFLYGASRISILNSALAHNLDRNIFSGGDYEPGEDFEIGNNIIYNYGGFGTLFSHNNDAYRVNLMYNRWKRGNNSSSSRYAVGVQESNGSRYFVKGNLDDIYRTSTSQPEWDIVGESATLNNKASSNNSASSAFDFPSSNEKWLSANQVESVLLPKMGAFPKDDVDKRIINDIKNGTGGVINSPYDVGGFPSIEGMINIPLDTDGDGIPDAWEILMNLDPLNFSDGNEDQNGNGYTAIEEYLYYLSQSIIE